MGEGEKEGGSEGGREGGREGQPAAMVKTNGQLQTQTHKAVLVRSPRAQGTPLPTPHLALEDARSLGVYDAVAILHVCACVRARVRVLRSASSPSCARLVCMSSRRKAAHNSRRFPQIRHTLLTTSASGNTRPGLKWHLFHLAVCGRACVCVCVRACKDR